MDVIDLTREDSPQAQVRRLPSGEDLSRDLYLVGCDEPIGLHLSSEVVDLTEGDSKQVDNGGLAGTEQVESFIAEERAALSAMFSLSRAAAETSAVAPSPATTARPHGQKRGSKVTKGPLSHSERSRNENSLTRENMGENLGQPPVRRDQSETRNRQERKRKQPITTGRRSHSKRPRSERGSKEELPDKKQESPRRNHHDGWDISWRSRRSGIPGISEWIPERGITGQNQIEEQWNPLVSSKRASGPMPQAMLTRAPPSKMHDDPLSYKLVPPEYAGNRKKKKKKRRRKPKKKKKSTSSGIGQGTGREEGERPARTPTRRQEAHELEHSQPLPDTDGRGSESGRMTFPDVSAIRMTDLSPTLIGRSSTFEAATRRVRLPTTSPSFATQMIDAKRTLNRRNMQEEDRPTPGKHLSVCENRMVPSGPETDGKGEKVFQSEAKKRRVSVFKVENGEDNETANNEEAKPCKEDGEAVALRHKPRYQNHSLLDSPSSEADEQRSGLSVSRPQLLHDTSLQAEQETPEHVTVHSESARNTTSRDVKVQCGVSPAAGANFLTNNVCPDIDVTTSRKDGNAKNPNDSQFSDSGSKKVPEACAVRVATAALKAEERMPSTAAVSKQVSDVFQFLPLSGRGTFLPEKNGKCKHAAENVTKTTRGSSNRHLDFQLGTVPEAKTDLRSQIRSPETSVVNEKTIATDTKGHGQGATMHSESGDRRVAEIRDNSAQLGSGEKVKTYLQPPRSFPAAPIAIKTPATGGRFSEVEFDAQSSEFSCKDVVGASTKRDFRISTEAEDTKQSSLPSGKHCSDLPVRASLPAKREKGNHATSPLQSRIAIDTSSRDANVQLGRDSKARANSRLYESSQAVNENSQTESKTESDTDNVQLGTKATLPVPRTSPAVSTVEESPKTVEKCTEIPSRSQSSESSDEVPPAATSTARVANASRTAASSIREPKDLLSPDPVRNKPPTKVPLHAEQKGDVVDLTGDSSLRPTQMRSWQSTVIIVESSDDDDDDNGCGRSHGAQASGKTRKNPGGIYAKANGRPEANRDSTFGSREVPLRKRHYWYTPPERRFRTETQFNFAKSRDEAFEEQERLFAEAAARVRQKGLSGRPARFPGAPTFTRPVSDLTKLNKDHWKWPCPHARLGLPRDASLALVKKQYRLFALAYHPDKSKLLDTAARFQAVTEAYHYLTRRPERL